MSDLRVSMVTKSYCISPKSHASIIWIEKMSTLMDVSATSIQSKFGYGLWFYGKFGLGFEWEKNGVAC